MQITGQHLRAFDHAASAALLRDVQDSVLLSLTDVRDNPERFFLAHRLIAADVADVAPGFWIRFTVHYNLCMGTVMALGESRHLDELKRIQARGDIGCFGLTERRAGVNSGMVVETVATFDPSNDSFVLNTPSEGAAKNWISSGLMANKAVVVADLRLPDGTSKGAHAFLVDLRVTQGGELTKGVMTGDMGVKTIANDLDNAWIAFDNVRVPHSNLLSRYGDVDAATGKYVHKNKSVRNFQMIGQRLFSGRVCVAQAALIFTRKIFEQTVAYAEGKRCWAPDGSQPVLADLPQLRTLFDEGKETLRVLDTFLSRVEAALCKVLRSDGTPSAELQLAIAVAKVAAVERSIALLARAKADVGSYALMADSGFQRVDFLQMCKFAEGDSRILSQKMARDRMALFVRGRAPAGGSSAAEDALCAELGAALAAGSESKAARAKAWQGSWRTVYRLADSVQERVLRAWVADSDETARATDAAAPPLQSRL